MNTIINKQPHHHYMRILFLIPFAIVSGFILYFQFDNKKQTFSAIASNDSVKRYAEKLDSSIELWDSLKPVVNAVVAKLKYQESLRNDYQTQVAAYSYQPSDNSNLDELKRKLSDANKEIVRLNGELSSMKRTTLAAKPKKDTVFVDKVDTPNENALLVDLDGKASESLTIYLIPYSKRAKRLMSYETSCDESIIHKNDYKIAQQYKGLYYFNSVNPGKYLIKICTYYGNYKVVHKSTGKEIVRMQVAPPLQ